MPLAGPANASVRLDDPSSLPPGDSAVIGYKLTDDRVVYTMVNQATGDTRTTTWLLTVPVAGPADDSRLVTFPLADDFIYELARDGRRVVFLLGTEVYSVPIEGGTHTRLNGAEDPRGFLRAGAGRVVYSAQAGTRTALFSAAIDGNDTRRDLTAPLGTAVSPLGRTLTPDGDTVVYIALRGRRRGPLQLAAPTGRRLRVGRGRASSAAEVASPWVVAARAVVIVPAAAVAAVAVVMVVLAAAPAREVLDGAVALVDRGVRVGHRA